MSKTWAQWHSRGFAGDLQQPELEMGGQVYCETKMTVGTFSQASTFCSTSPLTALVEFGNPALILTSNAINLNLHKQNPPHFLSSKVRRVKFH